MIGIKATQACNKDQLLVQVRTCLLCPWKQGHTNLEQGSTSCPDKYMFVISLGNKVIQTWNKDQLLVQVSTCLLCPWEQGYTKPGTKNNLLVLVS